MEDHLRQIFSDSQISFEAEALETYSKDWTTYYKPFAQAVVFPTETKELQELVKLARSKRWSLVPSGGRTGLSGGAVAYQGEIVVSFDRMNKILDFNEKDAQIHCQPGVITKQIQEAAESHDLLYPVDFASSGSSHIGGNIATNAGGIRVVKYGNTRNWVTGLQVVTGQPEVLELNKGLLKNNTGYDLRHLFIGSEGSLGFITELKLQLTKRPSARKTLFLGLDSWDSVLSVFSFCRRRSELSAYEVIAQSALRKVCESFHLDSPLETEAPLYVVMEIEVSTAESSAFDGFLDSLFESNEGILDGTLGQSSQQDAELWALRENISEALSKFKPYKNDISVLPSKIPAFVSEMEELLVREYRDYEVVWFGHVGDGNLHVNILKPESLEMDRFVQSCRRVDDLLFKLIEKYEGSVSAEHGVGLSKRDFLHYSRSLQEIELMRSIKKCFDPDGILNPSKIFI